MSSIDRSRPREDIAFALVPGFAMMNLACALEALREANRCIGYNAYAWHLVADAARVSAANGVQIPTADLHSCVHPYTRVFVCADNALEAGATLALGSWLQRQERQGARIGAVGAGTFVLAKADLLRGRRCTIHWESAPWLTDRFPKVRPSRRLFEIDDGLYTCSGGTAVTDLFLHIIAAEHGKEVGERLTQRFQLERIRSLEEEQNTAPIPTLGARPRKLQSAIREMERTLEAPVSPELIAARAGVTPRHLQRLFRAHAGVSPARFYMELRLRHAKLLLRQTYMPVLEVAVAVGFSSHSHFSKRYSTLR